MRRYGAVAVVVAGLAGLAIAQEKGAKHVLHEDLPGPSSTPSPMIGSGSGTPAAIAAGDKVLPKPSLDKGDAKKTGEPVLGEGGFAADRQTEMKPDANTGADNTLHYASVFNPDVLPFKRMSSLDGVTDEFKLIIGHDARAELMVGGTTDKTRDRFWGSVVVHLTPGKDIALPSVAPDMRILSYEIKPSLSIRFSKDGADNFYVRSDDAHANGDYRLVFLADADAGYFAPSLPPDRYSARQVWAVAPPEVKTILPPNVDKEAKRTLAKIHVDPDENLATSFNALVGYFRAFSAKQMPDSGADIYRELCDTQAGVCRHRAYAFMITAIALGIPTRFVENEAHAFVEVWFPQRGWQRIDLGGAALHLEVSGANDKTLHRPRADDPFEKPPAYKENYTQLKGDIRGLSDSQLADKQRPLDPGTASGSFAGPGKGNGNGSGNDSGEQITPDPTLPALENDPKKKTPRLAITTADPSAYRGDALHVEGRAEVDGKALPDHRIDVFLSPSGMHGQKSIRVGSAFTGADGTFKLDATLPGNLQLSTYEIYLSSPDDSYFNGALTSE